MVAHNRMPGGLLAVLLAGPIFSTALAIAIAARKMPGPISFTSSEIGGYAVVMLFSILVGAALALLPVMLGSLAMSALGNRWPLFRRPLSWILTGVAAGGAISLLWGTSADAWPGWFAMTATGALCAGIARWKVRWGASRVQPARSARTPAVAISA